MLHAMKCRSKCFLGPSSVEASRVSCCYFIWWTRGASASLAFARPLFAQHELLLFDTTQEVRNCIICLLQAIARPQLRESSAHQATIPDQIGSAPAPLELPLRWEPGPSYAEALASARGPEKAAADLLPLDATFDPETHEGAGKPLSFYTCTLGYVSTRACPSVYAMLACLVTPRGHARTHRLWL